jgi:hypothetical protein
MELGGLANRKQVRIWRGDTVCMTGRALGAPCLHLPVSGCIAATAVAEELGCLGPTEKDQVPWQACHPPRHLVRLHRGRQGQVSPKPAARPSEMMHGQLHMRTREGKR